MSAIAEQMGEVGDAIRSVFDDMAVAEQEIKAYQSRYPNKADLIWASFKLLRRTEALTSDTLYLAHVQEILDRVVAGRDTKLGTQAEALGAVTEALTFVKSNQTGALVMVHLLDGLALPVEGLREAREGLRAAAGFEQYAGSTAGIVAEIQRKLTVADRG